MSSPTPMVGADREPDHRAAEQRLVAAREQEEADMGDPDDRVRACERERVVAERTGDGQRGDDHRRHRGEDHDPHRTLLGIDDARQPRVARPGPPEHGEDQQAADEPGPVGVRRP